MSELAFDANGESFEVPANVAAWRVRRMKPRVTDDGEVVEGHESPSGFDINMIVAQLMPMLMASLASGKLPPMSALFDWRKTVPSNDEGPTKTSRKVTSKATPSESGKTANVIDLKRSPEAIDARDAIEWTSQLSEAGAANLRYWAGFMFRPARPSTSSVSPSCPRRPDWFRTTAPCSPPRNVVGRR